MNYAVITPVRNEGKHLRKTIDSVVSQTRKPLKWVIVNDGSADDTGLIMDAAAGQHAWIRTVHRPDRGFRKSGGGVVEAFYDGYALVQSEPWEFLAKLGGDLAFDPNYFEQCFTRFADNPRLGIGGGTVCRLQHGRLVEEVRGDPHFHVRGATKIYRRECWEQIGGLLKAPGWDTIDELTANMLGWNTRTFRGLKVHQLKKTGSADGAWRDGVKNGRANYITGYHPLFMFVKCLKRVFRRPFLINAAGLGCGYLSGCWSHRARRVADPRLIQYLRDQQWRKLTLRPSIWD
ncbi:MAG: glycosyltransferase family 2 protein [Verrucomicrobiota bacterium]|nr:glycosyltransferase family 2 protein [Verrucomicrobiota bacterium]